VIKIKGEDVKIEPSSSRRTTTKYQFSSKVKYGCLIIPEYQISPHYWFGADFKIQSGENINFYGEALKATDKNLWLGKLI